MKQTLLAFLFFLGYLTATFAQVIATTSISSSNTNLRGNPVVIGQVTINAPSNGKVILRFDGYCISAPGDRIILAASENNSWGANDGSVELEAADDDVNSNAFSHTRSYGVDKGENTFYAVAQNDFEMDGNGLASIYGNLTAEWFPIPSAGLAFAEHKGISFENVIVEGAPIAFSSIKIEAPVSGKVLVRFDGKCVSGYGDLIFFAASDTPTWGNYDGSSSNEVIDDDLDRFSFAHVRSYDVEPGSHTFYGVVENYFETYGNSFVSIYGSLTVQFYPDASISSPVFQTISTPFGVNIEGPPVTVGQLEVQAPVAGKVELNFSGTCIGNLGDQIRLAASDTPDWTPNEGNIIFEPYSSDLNRVSFSHTRVYEVAPGNHDFYAVIQNFEEFEGGGLAVVYASLTAKYFPDGTIATQEPEAFKKLSISPNPATDFIQIDFPALTREAFRLTLCTMDGRILKTFEKSESDNFEQLRWEVLSLPAGTYLVNFTNASGTATRPVVRI
jgi:hypothetical protein